MRSVSAMPQDANSSKPITHSFKGKALVAFKEVPDKPLCAAAIKDILDPNDCHASARANNSAAGDEVPKADQGWTSEGLAPTT
jgi:hypothetical protein